MKITPWVVFQRAVARADIYLCVTYIAPSDWLPQDRISLIRLTLNDYIEASGFDCFCFVLFFSFSNLSMMRFNLICLDRKVKRVTQHKPPTLT